MKRLKEQCTEITSTKSLLTTTVEELNKAVEESIGFSFSSKSKRKTTPWWSEKVKNAIADQTKAFRTWRKRRTGKQELSTLPREIFVMRLREKKRLQPGKEYVKI
jgi:hypothetical protein